MPNIPLYDGKMDLVAHVQTYRTWMNIAKADAATLCNGPDKIKSLIIFVTKEYLILS